MRCFLESRRRPSVAEADSLTGNDRGLLIKCLCTALRQKHTRTVQSMPIP